MVHKTEIVVIGDSRYPDMWGISVVNSRTWNSSSGWFIPSRSEWAAFADQLGITTSNYSSKDLSDEYWSSSQVHTEYAWYASFHYGRIGYDIVATNLYVRLGTTF